MKIKTKKLNRIWNKSGMRQIIESPHQTFNKQTNILDNNGNMIANSQICANIRAYNETECNNFYYNKGFLQDCDCQFLDPEVKEYIKTQDRSADFWSSDFYIKKYRFATFLLNKKTNDLKIFSFAKNKKQDQLIEWIFKYLFDLDLL